MLPKLQVVDRYEIWLEKFSYFVLVDKELNTREEKLLNIGHLLIELDDNAPTYIRLIFRVGIFNCLLFDLKLFTEVEEDIDKWIEDTLKHYPYFLYNDFPTDTIDMKDLPIEVMKYLPLPIGYSLQLYYDFKNDDIKVNPCTYKYLTSYQYRTGFTNTVKPVSYYNEGSYLYRQNVTILFARYIIATGNGFNKKYIPMDSNVVVQALYTIKLSYKLEPTRNTSTYALFRDYINHILNESLTDKEIEVKIYDYFKSSR